MIYLVVNLVVELWVYLEVYLLRGYTYMKPDGLIVCLGGDDGLYLGRCKYLGVNPWGALGVLYLG